VDQIDKRLDDRFRLLTGGGRTALERHQTLRAAIDWSYNLLSEDERWMLSRLSVFMGGWSLDAAEQACMRPGIELDVLDLLSHLVDKSLVIADSSAGEMRYHMLETTRQYALEKAIESIEAESAHGSHLLYFLALAEEAEEQLIGPDQAHWLDHLEQEHDNLRAALEWSTQAGRNEEALRMAGALGMFWLKHTHLSEGRSWLRITLEANPDAPDPAQIKARRIAGLLAFFRQDEPETIRLYTENLDREQALEDQWGMAFSLHMLANVAGDGDIEKARELHRRSIAISRAIRATWVQAMAEFSLGYIEYAGGNLALGVELSREGLSHFREVGDKWGMGMVLTNLGQMMVLEGDSPAAKPILLESLALSRELGDKDVMITALIGLAGVLKNEGEHILSARLHGVIVASEKELGTPLTNSPLEQRTYTSTADALREAMGPQAYQREFEAGQGIPLKDALRLVSGLS
jgi:non-specific serine/threonine protein kinase